MSLKISKQEPTVSEQEEAARLAEGRKATAQDELVILCEDKKRVSKELEDIQEDIKTNKEFLEKSDIEVTKTKGIILDLQNEQTKERTALNKILEQKDTATKEFEEFKQWSEGEITKIKSEISSLLISFTKEKEIKNKEISDLELSKTPIKEEIKKIENDLVNISEKQKIEARKLEELKDEASVVLKNKSISEAELEKINISIGDQGIVLKKTSIELERLKSLIEAKKSEITELDKNIEKKKEEYKELQKQAFAILEKSERLDQREEYIRSRYELAGIKWEE